MSNIIDLVVKKAWDESLCEYTQETYALDHVEAIAGIPSEFLCTMNLYANKRRADSALAKYDALKQKYPLRQHLDPMIHRIASHVRRSNEALDEFNATLFYKEVGHLHKLWSEVKYVSTESKDDDSCVPTFTHELYTRIGKSVLACPPSEYDQNDYFGLSTSTWLSLGEIVHTLLICSIRVVVFERHITECPFPRVPAKHDPEWRRHWRTVLCASQPCPDLKVVQNSVLEGTVVPEALNQIHQHLEAFMTRLVQEASSDYRTRPLQLLCLSWSLWSLESSSERLPTRCIKDKTILDIDENGIRGFLRTCSYAIERERRIRGIAQGRRDRKRPREVYFRDFTVVFFSIV